MKIESIEVKNFRGVKHVKVDTSGNTILIVGDNWMGKTSLMQAVQVALTGRCYDDDGRRIPDVELQGADKSAPAFVGLKIKGKENTHEINYVVADNGKGLAEINGKSWLGRGAAETARRAAFWKSVNLEVGHAECMINPRAQLTGENLGEILVSLGSNTATAKELRAACETDALWEWFLSGLEHYNLGNPDLSNPLLPDAMIPLTSLDRFGQMVFDDRREANKDIKKYKADLEREPMPVVNAPNGEPVCACDINAAGVDAQLTTLRAERDDLIQQIGAAQAKAEGAVSSEAMVTIEGDWKAAETELKEKRETLDTANRECSDLTQRESSARGECTLADSKAKDAEDAMEDLRGDVCPVCERKWTAALKKKMIAPARAAAVESSAAAAAAKAEHQTSEELHNEAITRRTEAETAFDKAQRVHADANVAWRAATGSGRGEAPSGADLSAIQGKVDAINARIAKGEEVRRAIDAAAKHTATQADLDKTQIERDNLDWAVKLFHHRKFQNAHISASIGPFLNTCDAFLEPYGKTLESRVSAKNELEVMLCRLTPDDADNSYSEGIPLRSASKGERLLVDWAIARAFGKGDGVVCIDDVDGLSGENKARFIAEAQRAKCGTLILAAAWTQFDTVDLPHFRTAIAPVTVIWMADGKNA